MSKENAPKVGDAELHSAFSGYYERTEESEPARFLQSAVSGMSERGEALELGAGAFVETEYLTSQGFHVTAIEPDKAALKYADREGGYEIVEKKFEDYEFPPETFNLIHARASLSFTDSREFPRVWTSIVTALKKGGILVGDFFGPNDGFNNPEHPMRKNAYPHMTFLNREEVISLLKDFEILRPPEDEYFKKNQRHLIRFVAKKK
jgi:SAM-dependent methyltransferase